MIKSTNQTTKEIKHQHEYTFITKQDLKILKCLQYYEWRSMKIVLSLHK